MIYEYNRKNMLKKMILNQINYAIRSVLILSVLFFVVNTLAAIFEADPTIKMGITLVYVLMLILSIVYGRSGLPSAAMLLSYYGFIAVWAGISLLSTLIPGQNSPGVLSQNRQLIGVVMAIIMVLTRFPYRIKARMQRWVESKGDMLIPINKNTLNQIGDHKKVKVTYSIYRVKRANKIIKSKPNHIRNIDSKQHAIRMLVYMICFMGGLLLVFAGLAVYDNTGGIFFNSIAYHVSLIGAELVLYGFFALLSGFKAAFRNAAIGSAVLLSLSFVLDQLIKLTSGNQFSFTLAMILYVMMIGVGLAFWIRQLLKRDTIAMLLFRRGEVWLGVELLLKQTLPIEKYDQMVVVEIKQDDKFEMADLMRLGSTIEVFAHFRKMIFAGLIFDPIKQKSELYFCTHKADYAQRKLKVFFKKHFHYPFTMTVLNDPLAILNERLNPTDLEMIEAMNRNTVMHYEDEGIDPAQLHSILVVTLFKNTETMMQAKADFEADGVTKLVVTDARKFKDEPVSDYNGWFVLTLETESRLGLDRINLMTRQLAEKIRPYQGTLSHWILGTLTPIQQDK